MRTMAMSIEEWADPTEVEERVDLKNGRAHRKNGMRKVRSTPRGDLCPAVIQLGPKIGSERRQRTMMSRDSHAYTEALPTMVVSFYGLVPASGHLPLVLGLIVGAD